jgi:hypothetical protein
MAAQAFIQASRKEKRGSQKVPSLPSRILFRRCVTSHNRSIIFASYWPELDHKSTLICKGGWEM